MHPRPGGSGRYPTKAGYGERIMEERQVIGPSEGLYNSNIFAAYVRFLRKVYPHVDIGDILNYAGIESPR